MTESVEDLAARIAGQYDETGALAAQALAALARRVATSGKVCARCHLEKPLSAFGARTANTDGLHDECRACRARPRRRAV